MSWHDGWSPSGTSSPHRRPDIFDRTPEIWAPGTLLVNDAWGLRCMVISGPVTDDLVGERYVRLHNSRSNTAGKFYASVFSSNTWTVVQCAT